MVPPHMAALAPSLGPCAEASSSAQHIAWDIAASSGLGLRGAQCGLPPARPGLHPGDGKAREHCTTVRLLPKAPAADLALQRVRPPDQRRQRAAVDRQARRAAWGVQASWAGRGRPGFRCSCSCRGPLDSASALLLCVDCCGRPACYAPQEAAACRWPHPGCLPSPPHPNTHTHTRMHRPSSPT